MPLESWLHRIPRQAWARCGECESSLALNPRSEVGYSNLAFLFVQARDFDKAIEYARKALEIYPRYCDAFLNLARGLAGKGRLEEAREAYQRARLNDPLLAQAVDDELKRLGEPRHTK